MRVLITGASGFVGRHLIEYLRRERPDSEVHGTYCGDLANGDSGGDVVMHELDLRSAGDLANLLHEVEPDAIFHLAAQSFVPRSWEEPVETLEINLLGTAHLFEAARKIEKVPTIQVAGSSEIYGLVEPEELPVRENQPLRPLSPYAVSKAAKDLLAFQVAASRGVPIIRTRAFNHTGPGQRDQFVAPSFARQIASIEAGVAEPVLRVGDLSPVRDFLDVRDVVRAYVLLVEQGRPGEAYNVASGRGIAIQEILDQLLDLSSVDVTVETDPDRLRPADMKVLIGDISKLRAATGWEPGFTLRQTLSDLLDEWRAFYAS